MASPLSISRAIRDAATKAGQPVSGDVQQLAQLISQLPAQDQAAYLAGIQQSIATGQIGSLTQAVLDSMAQQVQPQVQASQAASKQTAGQPTTTASAPAPQAATLMGAQVSAPPISGATSATPPAGTGGETVAGGTAASSGGSGTAGGAQTPSVPLANAGITQGELNTYTQSTDTSGYTMPTGSTSAQQLQYLAGYLGVSADQVQSQYNSYVASLSGQFGSAMSNASALPIDQWVAGQVNSIEGSYAPILNAYEQAWEQTNNGPMPPELRLQMRQQLQSMPPAQQQALNGVLYNYLLQWNSAQAATDPYQKAQMEQAALATVHGNFPLLDATFNNYQSTHLSSTAEANYAAQQQQSFIQTYVQATGRWPNQTEISKYGTLPAIEQGQYIDNAQMANLPMTYSAYQSTLSMLNAGGGGSGATSWQQAFGKDPTPEQVYNMSHMNAQDVRAYIDNSPSKEIPGMTVGVYGNLQQVGSDVSTKLFGTSDSSQLINMFHEANQKT
jgi:hypothetical protein